MANTDPEFLSRRRWLGLAAATTVGASGLLKSSAAESGAAISATDYGAAGDGVTLDTAAWRSITELMKNP